MQLGILRQSEQPYHISSRVSLVLVLLVGLTGCTYLHHVPNAPLKQWDPEYGYRFANLAPPSEGNTDSFLFVAAFSGGGTRASTLAFGALRELARQSITWEGREKRLLDELDVIFALSGGTFTAGYYGLFGERIFHDFEYRFLRKDWETELRSRILKSPSNWFRLWSPYFGRIHIMAELLDEALFEGKTYGDLLAQKTRPGILIHASDMATLARFEFVQPQFDMLCSDLSQLKIAYASAASAALPLVLSPITYQNFAGQCGYQEPEWLREARESRLPAQRIRANELLSYLNVDKRPFIHLLDGGLSDNIALRGLLEGMAVRGGQLAGLESFARFGGINHVRKLVILSVNAETSPDISEFKSDEIPVFKRTFGSLVDIPINRYSADTLLIMHLAAQRWREALRNRPADAESVFTPDADIYFIDANFSEIEDQAEREYLMKIPTTLYLTDEQIERLQLAASKLIRKSAEFQRLMQDLQ